MKAKESTQRILNIIGDVIGWNNLKESDGLSVGSYNQGELCLAFESEFEIDIWELDWNKINTVGELVSVVVERIESLK
jgi:acyl carrier protein